MSKPTEGPTPSTRAAVPGRAGALRPGVAGLIAVLGVAILGIALLAGLGSLGTASEEADVRAEDSAPLSAEQAAACARERRSDLLVDLGVQVGTGDPAQPLRSAREVQQLVDLAVAAGADVVSTDVGWQDVQPTREARPDWEGLDRLLDAVARHDLRVRVQLTGSPAWALDAPAGDGSTEAARWQPPRSEGELLRWQDFVEAALRHLDGRADFVEVWNEPDNPTYWTTGVDPAAFARLLEATAPVVRRWAPEARIISGGLAANDIGYLETLYRALAPGERPFDLVGVHPFTGSRPPGSQDPAARFETELGAYDLTFTGFRDLHAVMAEAGDGDLGLYVGEFGYSTASYDGGAGVPDAERARYLTEALDLAACESSVTALSWYYLHPTRWDDPAWTLLDERLRPSRTYEALVAWTRNRP